MPQVVRVYWFLPEAEAARCALEAAQIEARLHDAATIGVIWTYANAIHGIKLVVPAEKAEEATEILSVETEPDPLPAEEPPDKEPPETSCPDCGAKDYTDLPRLRIFVFVAATLIGAGVALDAISLFVTAAFLIAVMFMIAPNRRCVQCGERWIYIPPRREPPRDTEPPDVVCPRCGSGETHLLKLRRIRGALFLADSLGGSGFAVLLFSPFVAKRECESCGHGW